MSKTFSVEALLGWLVVLGLGCMFGAVGAAALDLEHALTLFAAGGLLAFFSFLATVFYKIFTIKE